MFTANAGMPVQYAGKRAEVRLDSPNGTLQTVYSISGLSSGNHMIKAVKKTGTYMVLDALNIYN
ncbi:hypothetical protein [Paenibacillus sp. Soil787]|uniref:hypothetical protein n=1 Tax=Paenibacillus sp. Soil787 TaxID=1736411 RepID=UPI001F281112|nr:hypothetical protein [Paenibacillus sp. Soil787]